MIFKGTSKGPDREYYLTNAGKLWIPAGRGLFKPSWGDLLKLSWLKMFGIEVVTEMPAIAGGSGFSGGGGGGGSEYFTMQTQGGTASTLVASSSYELTGIAASSPRTNPPRYSMPIPTAATLLQHYYATQINTTSPSNEVGVTVFACKNANTDTAGSAAAAWNGTIPYVVKGSETGLSVAYAAGDSIQGCLTTPAWGTNAAGAKICWTALFRI